MSCGEMKEVTSESGGMKETSPDCAGIKYGYIEIKSIYNIDNEVVLFVNLRNEVERNANSVKKFAKLPSPSNKTIVTTINYCLNYHYSR